jgi:hypothetical protein
MPHRVYSAPFRLSVSKRTRTALSWPTLPWLLPRASRTIAQATKNLYSRHGLPSSQRSSGRGRVGQHAPLRGVPAQARRSGPVVRLDAIRRAQVHRKLARLDHGAAAAFLTRRRTGYEESIRARLPSATASRTRDQHYLVAPFAFFLSVRCGRCRVAARRSVCNVCYSTERVTASSVTYATSRLPVKISS